VSSFVEGAKKNDRMYVETQAVRKMNVFFFEKKRVSSKKVRKKKFFNAGLAQTRPSINILQGEKLKEGIREKGKKEEKRKEGGGAALLREKIFHAASNTSKESRGASRNLQRGCSIQGPRRGPGTIHTEMEGGK